MVIWVTFLCDFLVCIVSCLQNIYVSLPETGRWESQQEDVHRSMDARDEDLLGLALRVPSNDRLQQKK